MAIDPALARAREALARQDWPGAFEAYGAADRATMTGADLAGHADAAWWQGHLPESIQLRTEAYAAFDADGDDVHAVRQAGRLAIEHFIRGDAAVGSGFLMRAERHDAELTPGRDHGFIVMLKATVALNMGDPQGALDAIGGAVDLARGTNDLELVAMAIHTQGLALIDLGRVPEGLSLLDEAMAGIVAGQVGPYFTGIIYCSLISACLTLADLRRAGEWSEAARAWCETIPPDSPYPGICRANRAQLARLRGAWVEAEAEATRACEELLPAGPGLAAAAYLQLAEIRRRRGDTAGADDAYARAHELGEDVQPGLALLRSAQGKGSVAMPAVAASLEGAVASTHRMRLLTAMVEIALADGQIGVAREAAEQLRTLAETAGTPAYTAAAATAGGGVALAAGDVGAALAQLHVATSTWQELRLPHEHARTRVTYAQALRAAGDDEGAVLELRAALATFEWLGAVPDIVSTAALLGDGGGSLPGGLTAREAEVLGLVTAGKTNKDIAVELVISEHTVGRHLQNIYAKLDVSSRAAATRYAFEHGLA